MMGVLDALRRARTKVGAFASAEMRRTAATRRRLSSAYLQGEGLEIGALHKPLPLPRGVRVRYVDRMGVRELRHHYPELAPFKLVDIDLIDDGETLATVADASADFIIANHFIEHTENPLGTLARHLEILRPGGILYLAVPDMRRTFDRARTVTPVAHVAADRRHGPAISRRAHFEEWARDVEGVPEADVAERARVLDEQGYSIHFHVWTPEAFRGLLEHARTSEGLPFSLEALESNGVEFVCILRRR
jgi:SAM-dependent methyltransferase